MALSKTKTPRLQGQYKNHHQSKEKAVIQNSKVSLREATSLLDKAFKHYKIIRKQDEKHSVTFREKLAEDKAKEGNMTAATAL